MVALVEDESFILTVKGPTECKHFKLYISGRNGAAAAAV